MAVRKPRLRCIFAAVRPLARPSLKGMVWPSRWRPCGEVNTTSDSEARLVPTDQYRPRAVRGRYLLRQL